MDSCCLVKNYHDKDNKNIRKEYYQHNGKKEGKYKKYYENKLY